MALQNRSSTIVFVLKKNLIFLKNRLLNLKLFHPMLYKAQTLKIQKEFLKKTKNKKKLKRVQTQQNTMSHFIFLVLVLCIALINAQILTVNTKEIFLKSFSKTRIYYVLNFFLAFFLFLKKTKF